MIGLIGVCSLNGCLAQLALYGTQRHSKRWDIWQWGLSLWSEASALVGGRLDVDRKAVGVCPVEILAPIPGCHLTSSPWPMSFKCYGNDWGQQQSRDINEVPQSSIGWLWNVQYLIIWSVVFIIIIFFNPSIYSSVDQCIPDLSAKFWDLHGILNKI